MACQCTLTKPCTFYETDSENKVHKIVKNKIIINSDLDTTSDDNQSLSHILSSRSNNRGEIDVKQFEKELVDYFAWSFENLSDLLKESIEEVQMNSRIVMFLTKLYRENAPKIKKGIDQALSHFEDDSN